MAIKVNPQRSNLANTAFVYPFGLNLPSPPLDKFLLGGKGAGLAEMATLNIPIPPGFIITTKVCHLYRSLGGQFPEGLETHILQAIKQLEQQMSAEFGSATNPLLVSVRSGAPVSMPGMMDTILDLGLNDESVKGFAKKTNNERLAYDSYRRFIMMYAGIVEKVNRKYFEHAFEELKHSEGAHEDTQLSIQGLKEVCKQFKVIFEKHTGKKFPENANEQLFEAIKAVFNSWDSERAVLYRHLNHIPDDMGTAVAVQAMVFGNKNEHSATGVAFTRNPANGIDEFFGEFLPNAQGEEVVAGIRTPHPINKYQKELMHSELQSLEELMPDAYEQLRSIAKTLERHFKEMQDIEFTIDDGRLFMLQTRTGKRTGFAAVKIAMEMLESGLVDEKTALKMVNPDQLVQLLAPVFDQKAKRTVSQKLAAHGLNAGPGAASGKAVFSSKAAVESHQKGVPCILVREETNPDDFPGLVAAEGILTLKGGSTSHAAVVARGMGKPCIVGCDNLSINESTKQIFSKKDPERLIISEGDPISIDGTTGEVFFCGLETSPSEIVQVLLTKTKHAQDSKLYQQYEKLMSIADRYRKMKVRANADTPGDARAARLFGAEGIGLCRTEHMFFEVNRLNDVRCMLFSTDAIERKHAIDRLLPHQKEDFIGIFQVMSGLPVTIRLLDPPLHEFMPHTDSELKTLAKFMHVSSEELATISDSLEEQNPMLGHRGCRLGVTYPELTAMQSRAILEAAIEVSQQGIQVFPEIMVPLVSTQSEFEHQKAIIDITANEVFAEKGISIPYSVGTMIELPRAALIADKIAEKGEFFSFGTNDLTQTTFGISRDDSNKFVPIYVQGVPKPGKANELLHIMETDPFQVIDQEGVGQLMQMAITLGKQVRPQLKCGICGEHGGDPSSVIFCHELGLDYVSCSPFRVPVARFAAAIANLN